MSSAQERELILSLGKAIKARRLKAGLTQVALGSKAGLHPTWISQIENGRVNPTVINLSLLSGGLGIGLSELILLAEELNRATPDSDGAPPAHPR